jgi:hypothetical protein
MVENPSNAPSATGGPAITALTARATDPSCPDGTTPLEVTYTLGDGPTVRVVSVFLDGTPAGSSTEPEPLTVPAVPCDGAAHSVLFVATTTEGASSAQAVAFRAPVGG